MKKSMILACTCVIMLLVTGIGCAEMNLTGNWTSSENQNELILIDEKMAGIWQINSTTGVSEITFSIKPIEENVFVLHPEETGLFIGVFSPVDGIILYNMSTQAADKSLPALRFMPSKTPSIDRGIFLSGFSTGVGASQEEIAGADAAGIEGNGRFDEDSPIDCDDDMCTCDGETCTCSGPDCRCDGGDCVENDNGYTCSGWDCWFVCKAGDDCSIPG